MCSIRVGSYHVVNHLATICWAIGCIGELILRLDDITYTYVLCQFIYYSWLGTGNKGKYYEPGKFVETINNNTSPPKVTESKK